MGRCGVRLEATNQGEPLGPGSCSKAGFAQRFAGLLGLELLGLDLLGLDLLGLDLLGLDLLDRRGSNVLARHDRDR
jgi:hypothetical protein